MPCNPKKIDPLPVYEPLLETLLCPGCREPLFVQLGVRGPVWVCGCEALRAEIRARRSKVATRSEVAWEGSETEVDESTGGE